MIPIPEEKPVPLIMPTPISDGSSVLSSPASFSMGTSSNCDKSSNTFLIGRALTVIFIWLGFNRVLTDATLGQSCKSIGILDIHSLQDHFCVYSVKTCCNTVIYITKVKRLKLIFINKLLFNNYNSPKNFSILLSVEGGGSYFFH